MHGSRLNWTVSALTADIVMPPLHSKDPVHLDIPDFKTDMTEAAIDITFVFHLACVISGLVLRFKSCPLLILEAAHRMFPIC